MEDNHRAPRKDFITWEGELFDLGHEELNYERRLTEKGRLLVSSMWGRELSSENRDAKMLSLATEPQGTLRA